MDRQGSMFPGSRLPVRSLGVTDQSASAISKVLPIVPSAPPDLTKSRTFTLRFQLVV